MVIKMEFPKAGDILCKCFAIVIIIRVQRSTNSIFLLFIFIDNILTQKCH